MPSAHWWASDTLPLLQEPIVASLASRSWQKQVWACCALCKNFAVNQVGNFTATLIFPTSCWSDPSQTSNIFWLSFLSSSSVYPSQPGTILKVTNRWMFSCVYMFVYMYSCGWDSLSQETQELATLLFWNRVSHWDFDPTSSARLAGQLASLRDSPVPVVPAWESQAEGTAPRLFIQVPGIQLVSSPWPYFPCTVMNIDSTCSELPVPSLSLGKP